MGVESSIQSQGEYSHLTHAFEVLKHFEEEMAVEGEKPDIGFHREGYLFLIDQEGEKGARSSLALQKELGAEVEWWSPDQIKKEFPLLDVSLWVGGTYGPQDGYLDGYAFLMAYRAKARSLGARFENGTVISLETGAKLPECWPLITYETPWW
jgi:glycine/D-amino acid oxidase-like deaminating enzyme